MNTRDQGDGFYRRYGKRLFDIALALPALIVLAPLMAALAVVVRVSQGPPAFFRQRRPGWHHRPFTLYKFRTMAEARDGQDPCSSDAERLTPVGRTLRRLSLDELPEFLNVLRGDMSLVGPRPLLMQYLERYTPEQARRHEYETRDDRLGPGERPERRTGRSASASTFGTWNTSPCGSTS